ncbi:MAG: flagellar hook-basal body complex protein FliE [Sulfurimonas sp.]|jgi:flagellar hook-basal body complex protein FliE|uniref:flagellar hook-basal body complex protein FliE n=1 Tax=Sulfurimonas sp. TaxID=2022749 RepID=UPI002610C608|nr:flagellar hook-basal body complex protein FliE [Sulfurimonas sp.]MDD3476276.1 flagellar hook-basal body complex protein FliE [Sulfurimonas sp.]HUH42541.1 flagellar hook-basal body complex protein FliE [Sulfurimonas sp.]
MSPIDGISGISSAELLKQKSQVESAGGEDFANHLKSAINEVNELQQNSEAAIGDLATGQVKDLHQAALAINKAETSMKLMLEIRNKALNAYKELGRTQL